MADTNRTGLRYIQETTWNSLPATPNMQVLRYTGESFNHEIETIVSAEMRADRMISDTIQVSQQNVGGFDFELSYGSFDDLLEGAFFSTWATNVLKNGTTKANRSFSVEKAHLDIDEYFLFTGCYVNEFNLTLATGSIATGSFGFMGSTATLAQATNATTLTAANSNDVMNSMGDVADLSEGTYAGTLSHLSGIYVQELSLTLNNNLRPISAVGSSDIQEVGMGTCDVTGSLNAYFTSDRLFDKFLAATAMQLSFTISDGSNDYTFFIPKAKFETDSIPAPGKDQDVIENLTWRALYDSSENAQISITRSG